MTAYSRKRLPHIDAPHTTQFVTFCLFDAFSRNEYAIPFDDELSWDDAIDRGLGSCLLAIPEVATIVDTSVRYFDGERYDLHAWCVMPNHVHVLVTTGEELLLSEIVVGWKRFTARAINRIAARAGAVWARDHFDRYIRDNDHFVATKHYIENNPVKAGLVSEPRDWPYSSATMRATTYPDLG